MHIARFSLLLSALSFEISSLWTPEAHKNAPHHQKTQHANNQPLPMTIHNKIKAGQNHHQTAEKTAKA